MTVVACPLASVLRPTGQALFIQTGRPKDMLDPSEEWPCFSCDSLLSVNGKYCCEQELLLPS